MSTPATIIQRLPAEWEPQDAIMLTWPHPETAWYSRLDEIVELHEALATVIADYADVVISVPPARLEEVRERLEAMGAPMEYIYLFPCETNDIWARDHGPLTVQTADGFKMLDFKFNGWGNKHPFALDDQITQVLHSQNAFPLAALEQQDWILEGGSIETDGRGTLLTTESCLLNENRNAHLAPEEIEQRLKDAFGIRKINWLHYGQLAGDDTDGHIDTLARICPDNVIVYTACDDEQDEHYADLKRMEAELKTFTDADGQPYRLFPLPWPSAVFNEDGQRLPATYANFLIINEAVLVPIYNQPTDEDALEVITQAFPGFDILGIPCSILIEHGGSLHCITMQLPEGVLEPVHEIE